MAIRSVTPVREVPMPNEEAIILFEVSEECVQTALRLYRQNRIYDFVNLAMTVWTDWRVFARLAVVVDDYDCTEHGDRTPGFVKIRQEEQLPFKAQNLSILKTLIGHVLGPLTEAMQSQDSDAYLCFALLLRVGIIKEEDGGTYKKLVETAMALGSIEAQYHYSVILSRENGHAISNTEEVLPVSRKIVELREAVANAGYVRVAHEMGFTEEYYLKQEFDLERHYRWEAVAAEFGGTQSLVEVGSRLMYRNDTDPVVWKKGMEMLERAYELQSPTAAYCLGRIYSCNRFVAKNPSLALEYFDTAKKWKKREFVGTFAGTSLAFVKMRDLDQSTYGVDDAIDELQHSIPSSIQRDIPDGRNDGHDINNNVYFINDYVRQELGYDGAVSLIRRAAELGVDVALKDLPNKLLRRVKDFVVMTDYWCGIDMPLFQWSERDQAFSSHFRCDGADAMAYWGEDWQATPPPPQMTKDIAHKIMRYLNDRCD